MNTTFNYKSRLTFSAFYPAIIFIILTFFLNSGEYSVAVYGFTILAYPFSIYVSGILAILSIAYAGYKIIQFFRTHKENKQINITESNVTFPEKQNSVTINFCEIEKLSNEKDDDEESLIIYTNNQGARYRIESQKFDNKGAFDTFQKLMKQYCVCLVD